MSKGGRAAGEPITDAALAAWCGRWLGAEPAAILFRAAHLSAVTGLRLADGREVVVKARPPSACIEACFRVQRRLWSGGYPCAEPLAGPAPLGALTATAEGYLPGGQQLERTPEMPARFAAGLAELVALAPPVGSLPSLDPAPPWVGWGHAGPGIWPWPDDRDADLNAHPGPAWLDEAGRRVRERLARYAAEPVIGHADWESQNLRWTGGRLHAVHDWDSVAALPEAALAGAASGVFPADGRPDTAATLDESAAFIDAYARARGRAWSDDEREVCWAAGLWVRAFNAKKAALDGHNAPTVRLLAAEVEERLRRAGA